MIPPLYILRHGQTEWNLAGRFQGKGDSPLTEKGRAQARAQGAVLRAHRIGPETHDAFVSPLGRTRETAALALGDWAQSATLEPRIAEIGVGGWEGLTRDQIALPRDSLAEMMTWYDAAPGGEGVDALVRRLAAFLQGLSRPSVAVTHGVATRMLRCELLGCAPEDLTPPPDGGQGWVLRVEDGAETWLAVGAG